MSDMPEGAVTYLPIKRPPQKWEQLVEALTVTQEQVQSIEDAEPIWHKLLWHQKYHVWCAPPGAGKTAIATQAASDLSAAGFDVLYFNLDSGAADLKYYFTHAEATGYRLIAPMREGSSDQDALRIIDAMQNADDLGSVVLFLDTLKKFVEVISKRDAPAFYKKLRTLTRRGCTIVVLAHTNKYKSETGELIYEGGGDLKSDADMLMFLYHLKDDVTGDLAVSTKFEKDRAPVEDATFRICRGTRAVQIESGYRDTLTESVMRTKEAADRTLIEFFKSRLPCNQSVLVADAKAQIAAGRRTVERVLRTYIGRHWLQERALARNERRYRNLP